MRPIDDFDRVANIQSHRRFLTGNGVTYTYGDAAKRSQDIARVLVAGGIAPGAPVAIYAPNDPVAMLCVLGLLRAGAAWVPANPKNPPEITANYLNYVRAEWLFYHSSLRDAVAELKRRLPHLRNTVCMDAELTEDPSLDGLIEQAQETPLVDWADPFGNPDHPFALWPTGGTTGPSKAVLISNRVWRTVTDMGTRYWDIDAPPVHLVVAPITHGAGGLIMVLSALGATHLIHAGFDPLNVLQAIERERVTHLFIPPTAFYALLAYPQVKDFDVSSLKQLLVASAPVSADKLRQGIETFGPCVCQCFGQTEVPLLISWLPPEVMARAAAGDHSQRLLSCGRPTAACRVAIMNDEGGLLGPGEQGEIVVQGPLVTPGYFERPDATAEMRTHGWHHTGDIGSLDEDGYLYIVDRKKDMIITGGFNVFAVEVEAPILALSEVLECAVIGLPDEKWGEAVTAFVVRKPGAVLSEAQIVAACRAEIGNIKAPKNVIFSDALPKTPNGKLDKKTLRAPYWTGRTRNV